MMKALMIPKASLPVLALAALTWAASAQAEPVSLTAAQMDSVTAGADAFVCPVITTNAVLNSPKGMAIGEGHYTIIGPDVSVPIGATNDDGAAVPGGPHLQPGETGYTAIWAK